MRLQIVSGVIAISLFVAYFSPILVKLKDVPLGIVLLGGMALVAIDFWESLKS